MEIEIGNLTSDVQWLGVIVYSSFFLIHHKFADRNNEVDIHDIDLIEGYFCFFVYIEKEFNTVGHDLGIFSSEPSLVVFEVREN